MRIEFISKVNVCCTLTEDGIIIGGEQVRWFYPYGGIRKISVSLGCLFFNGTYEGEERQAMFAYNPEDKAYMIAAMNYAKRRMKSDSFKEMKKMKPLSRNEAERLFKKKELKREGLSEITAPGQVLGEVDYLLKRRTIGLVIALVCGLMALIACFMNGGTFAAVLGGVGSLGCAVGIIIIKSNWVHYNVPVKDTSAKSGTKEIVKGAVVGGVVAGGPGAVVGAIVAKNKIDQGKK